MGVAFRLGSFTVGWYGLLITLAVIAAIAITIIEARRHGEKAEHVLNAALIVLPLGIIGVRLYHVTDKWDFYSQNPILILGDVGWEFLVPLSEELLGSSSIPPGRD